MPERTATSPLAYEDRYVLAITALQMQQESRGMLTDSDLLDTAEDFTTTDLGSEEPPDDYADYERLRDDIYDSVEEG